MQKVVKVDRPEIPVLILKLKALFPKHYRKEYHWQFEGGDQKIMVYDTGKIMLQGKQISDNLDFLFPAAAEKIWGIGTDESGKGDIFGGICIAAAFVDAVLYSRINHLLIADSKSMSEKQLNIVVHELKSLIPHHIILLDPPGYNQLYARYQNINMMLAYLHANAAGTLSRQTGCQTVICDQFSQSPLTLEHVLPLPIRLIQDHHAEEKYIPVAVASIFARQSFINHIHQLSHACCLDLPRGATISDKQLRSLLSSLPFHDFSGLVKLHFKPIQRLLSSE